MNKPNKAPQKKLPSKLVMSSQLYTPTAYADHIGKSRQQIYNDINGGKIPADNIIEINGGTLILAERTKL